MCHLLARKWVTFSQIGETTDLNHFLQLKLWKHHTRDYSQSGHLGEFTTDHSLAITDDLS